MTNSLDINILAQLAQHALDEQANGREYMLVDVYNQTRQAYAQFPEDAVIRQVASTIERMTDRAQPGATINQSQMSEIYNHFAPVSQSSNFRRVLGHLLKDAMPEVNNQNPDYSKLNRVDADNSQLTENDYVNQDLVSALKATFGGSFDEVKTYSTELARKGVDYVKAELQALGYSKPEVEVMGGDNHTLVYASHFDTNKGRVTVAIPIDLSGGKLVLPSTFVADNKLAELSAQNISYFVDKKSEMKDFSVPPVRDVLRAVGILTGRATKASADEFNAAMSNFAPERSDERGSLQSGDNEEWINLTTPQLFSDRQNRPEPRPYIDTTPQVEMPKELAHLARDFEDSLLEATSSFGKESVEAGKRLVLTELASAQLKNAQVKFGSETQDTIVYLAAINTAVGAVDIEVPVEMRALHGKYVPLVPSYFVHEGTSREFTGPQLQRFAAEIKDASYSEVTADQYKFMVLPELHNEILRAAGVQNYRVCEAILQHIANTFSEEDYRNAVNDYQYALLTKNSVTKEAERVTCSKMIAAGKGSVYPRCGHFGVPLHQVVNDAEGHCRLKTAVERERMNPVEESSASISSAKVFMS